MNYERLLNTRLTDLEIDKVATYVFLSTGMTSTTERIPSLISEINSGKSKYMYHVNDFNSSRHSTKTLALSLGNFWPSIFEHTKS